MISSGPYDVWAVDNLEIFAYGGISSDNRTVCRSPPTNIGIRNAEVTLGLNGQQFSKVGAGNPAGQTKFIYYAEPIIESIRPSGGPAGGGTFITLIGSGFTNLKVLTPFPASCKFTSIHDPRRIITAARFLNDSLLACQTPNATVWYNTKMSHSFYANL